MGRLIYRVFQCEVLLSADCCLSQYEIVCDSIKKWCELIYPHLSWL